MEKNKFQYVGRELIVTTTEEKFPDAIGVIKDYLLSRMPRGEEDIPAPNIPANPWVSVIDLSTGSSMFFETDPALLRRGVERARESQDGLAEKIQGIPSDAAGIKADYSAPLNYSAQFNITRGYRQANVAKVVLAPGEEEVSIKVGFGNNTGDDTRPLFWMQYDALLNAAESAGFETYRGNIDQEIEEFKSDKEGYFMNNTQEAMSAFHPSELDLVLSFLWPKGIPEGVKKQLRH